MSVQNCGTMAESSANCETMAESSATEVETRHLSPASKRLAKQLVQATSGALKRWLNAMQYDDGSMSDADHAAIVRMLADAKQEGVSILAPDVLNRICEHFRDRRRRLEKIYDALCKAEDVMTANEFGDREGVAATFAVSSVVRGFFDIDLYPACDRASLFCAYVCIFHTMKTLLSQSTYTGPGVAVANLRVFHADLSSTCETQREFVGQTPLVTGILPNLQPFVGEMLLLVPLVEKVLEDPAFA